jgi:hypothetical protein
MSVNRAYITSLWTTGILVASSILVLALTSAIVAFDRWPGNAAGAPVDRLTVAPPAPDSLVTSTGAAGPPAASARLHAGSAPVRYLGGGPATPRSQTLTSTPPRQIYISSPAGAPSPGKPPSRTPTAPKSDPGPGAPIRIVGNTTGGQLDPVSPQAGGLARDAGGGGADAVDAIVRPPG